MLFLIKKLHKKAIKFKKEFNHLLKKLNKINCKEVRSEFQEKYCENRQKIKQKTE